MNEKKDVLRPTDAEAILLAKELTRTARYAVIATLEPGTGNPVATRVGVSTDIDGTPTILVSALSAHTPALLADPRCSILVGEPGKGDPLAHPRVTIHARARQIQRGSDEHARIERRYISHNPKAKLYAGLGDFSFFRLEPSNASLNGGFGKAYALKTEQLLTLSPANDELAAAETGALEHMNKDHLEAIDLYARFYAGASPGRWAMIGVDADGMEIANGDDVRRIVFEAPLTSAKDMHMTLVRMAGEARAGLTSGKQPA
ncbi:MAG: HugZ family protein [Phyllobacterium sp.]